jgi:predicted regulator of Ras-like GTPase activity (Roadblock/LC7/MglB family)
MTDVFKEIAVLPGVAGSCLFNRSRGSLSSDLPASFAADQVQEVVHQCARLLQMGEVAGLDMQILALAFDRFTLLAMPVDKETILLTVCEADSNCSLVATTISMLAGELQSWLVQSAAASAGAPAATASPAGKKPAAPEENLAPLLTEIGEALAFAIGPVAGLVLEDYVERWGEKGAATKSRLAELTEMLVQEIDDERLAADFRKRLAGLLKK